MSRSGGGPKSLATTVSKVTRKALGRRGLAEAGLVANWRDIVGDGIAERTSPDRLVFRRGERRDGTLYVRVAGGWATELQHLEPQFLERVNAYFGYRAVARLRLVQSDTAGEETRRPEAPRRAPRRLTGEERNALETRLAGIRDPALRAALSGLGEAVLGESEEES